MSINNINFKDFIRFDNEKIHWGYTSLVKDDKGKSIAYVPSFDIYVSGSSHEDVRIKTKIMIKHFIEYTIQEDGWKKFILTIHKLGFKVESGHQTAMMKLMNGSRPSKSNFNYAIKDVSTPQNFSDAIATNELAELVM